MKDRELFRLMQLIPEEYPEETAAFLAAHGKAGESGKTEPVIRQKKAEPQAGILWRVLLPAGAAACLAVLIGTGLWAGLREKPMTAASSEPELTEIAVQTETAPTQIAEVTAAVQQTVTNTVTQSAVKNGTVPAVQSSTPAVTAAAEDKPQTTARQQAKPQSTVAPEQQPAPETNAAAVPPRNPDYPPGDVNMDGRVDTADAQLLYQEYHAVVVEGGSSILTPEQIALGDVYPNTAEEDVEAIARQLCYDPDTMPTVLIATDYPISYLDVRIVLGYYAEMQPGGMDRVLDLFTADDFAHYLGLPPEEEQAQFITPPTVLQGDTLPADCVTVPDFGSYPVSPEGWTMQYAKVTKPGDFRLWYDGSGLFENCRILVFGTNSYNENEIASQIKSYEYHVGNGTMQKIPCGETVVYRTMKFNPRSGNENWREDNPLLGRNALQWFTGQYKITVYTEEQYSDEILQQIAECFTAYPAN